MANEAGDLSLEIFSRLSKLLGWLGLEQIGELVRIIRKLVRRYTFEGIYEVLDYETILELVDRRGERAKIAKIEKVRYLQNKIYAFQDQAWGDGEILIDYLCNPGISVDRYRSGYKTIILISLRSVRNRGDIDEFKINWEMNRGFLVPTGFWATEISHRTRHVKVRAIFPKSRPPASVSVLEKNRQRNIPLESGAIQRLPDGRWEVCWERSNPRLYEQYILNWSW